MCSFKRAISILENRVAVGRSVDKESNHLRVRTMLKNDVETGN